MTELSAAKIQRNCILLSVIFLCLDYPSSFSLRLKDETTRHAFRQELRNRFQILGEEHEMNIDQVNQIFKAAGEKVLGFKRRKKEEWIIKEQTWKKIDERKVMKQRVNSAKSERIRNQLRQKYSVLDKEVKRMAKMDKKDYVEKLADEAEEATRRQDLKTLYRINKSLNNRFRTTDAPVGEEPKWKPHLYRNRDFREMERPFRDNS